MTIAGMKKVQMIKKKLCNKRKPSKCKIIKLLSRRNKQLATRRMRSILMITNFDFKKNLLHFFIITYTQIIIV